MLWHSSSRLFDEIRERRGLAYSVYAFDHSFADVGVLQLSAGLESGRRASWECLSRDRST